MCNEYLMLGFEGYKEEGIFWLLSQMLRYWLLGSYIHLINVFFLLFLGCWHISLLAWVCFSLQCYYILWYEISGIISLLSYLLSLFSSYFMMLEVREFLKDTSVSILMIKTARKPPNYLPILIKFILCSM